MYCNLAAVPAVPCVSSKVWPQMHVNLICALVLMAAWLRQLVYADLARYGGKAPGGQSSGN